MRTRPSRRLRFLELESIDGIRLHAAVHPAPEPSTIGTVVLVHGITANMDEGGMFIRLADRLAEAGFTALRFSFRGHGRSSGTQRGVTIAGEMLDLQAVIDLASTEYPALLSIVAASFGVVPTALSLPYVGDGLTAVVLWNPVLDLRRTFLEPELPWGLENFGPARQKALRSQGFLLVDGEFEMGRVLFEELRLYRPAESLCASGMPALVVHGDKDTYVSYQIAIDAAARRPNTDFHTVAGSDHGFDSREREDEAIAVTVDWLVSHHTGRVP